MQLPTYNLLLLVFSRLILAFIEPQEPSILPFTPALAANNETAPQNPESFPNPSQDEPSEPLATPTKDETLHLLDLRSVPSPTQPFARRQDPCASSYAQCPQSPSLCCPDDARCLPDDDGMVGCCANGAACTGVVPEASSSPTSTATESESASAIVSATSSAENVVESVTSSAFTSGETVFAASAPRGRDMGGMAVAVGAVGGVLML